MKQVFLFFFCLLMANFLSATDRFVTTESELENAIDDSLPGDVIVMQDGTWADIDILFDVDGSSSASIELRAETAGMVTITGNSSLRIAGDYLVVSGLRFDNCVSTLSNLISFRRNSSDLASHSRLTETAVVNCNPPDNDENYKWIGIYGSDNEVDHCYIANKTHIGATLVVWSTVNEGNHHVHHNYFGPRPRPAGDGNGYETIRIGTSSFAQNPGFNLVEHNYFYQTDGEIEIISGKSSFSTYRYNIFRECRGGLTLRHGTNCLVEGNIFFGAGKQGSYGVRIIDREHTVINNYFEGLDGGSSQLRFPITLMSGETNPVASGYQHVVDVNVGFNTIVNCTKGIMFGAESRPVAPDNVTVANNVLTITGAPPVVYVNTPTNSSYSGNFFHRTDDVVSLPASGFVDQDPQLSLSPGDSIYRPLASSPVIGAAQTNAINVANDFEGQSRPANPACGADELSSAPAIDRGFYGPSWLQDGTLPVELSAFTVQQQADCAEVLWTSINEENVTGYRVLRSTDGANYVPVGNERAIGEAGQLVNYVHEDCGIKSLNAATLYYQLETVDFDGTIQRSEIITLKLSHIVGAIVLKTPQQGGHFSLYYTSENGTEAASITAYTIDGRLVVPETRLSPGIEQAFGSRWRAGQYVIRCVLPDGNTEVLRWTK